MRSYGTQYVILLPVDGIVRCRISSSQHPASQVQYCVPVIPARKSGSLQFMTCGRIDVEREPAASFDHIVGTRQHRCRHFKADRLGGLEVDHQLEPGRLNDG